MRSKINSVEERVFKSSKESLNLNLHCSRALPRQHISPTGVFSNLKYLVAKVNFHKILIHTTSLMFWVHSRYNDTKPVCSKIVSNYPSSNVKTCYVMPFEFQWTMIYYLIKGSFTQAKLFLAGGITTQVLPRCFIYRILRQSYCSFTKTTYTHYMVHKHQRRI